MPPRPDPAAAWDELTEQLVALTEKVRSTYRDMAPDSGPSAEEISDALRTLAAAGGHVAASIRTASRDPAVRSHLRNAAGSMVAAVRASLSEVLPDEEAPPRPTDDGESPA